MTERPHLQPSGDVRWMTSDRGLRYYAPVDGHEVHESSAAESPHLWIDDQHVSVEAAAAQRDALPPGPLRDLLTTAIDGHYQTRTPKPDWAAGDLCEMCGSTDTHLWNDVASCDGCGAAEAPDA